MVGNNAIFPEPIIWGKQGSIYWVTPSDCTANRLVTFRGGTYKPYGEWKIKRFEMKI